MKAIAKEGLKQYNANDLGVYKPDFEKLLKGQPAEVPNEVITLYPHLFEVLDCEDVKEV